MKKIIIYHYYSSLACKCSLIISVYPIILYLTVCHSAMGLIVIPNYKLSYINTGILMKW